MSRIISYRGLLADGGQDTINLHTNDGKTGYRINKFNLMPYAFGTSSGELESVVKLYSVQPSSVDGLIDFSDQELLGAAIMNAANFADSYPTVLTTVFDLMTFNQDIYVTHSNQHADAGPVSYYIELEQIDLTEDQALVAIVKNLRNEQ